MAREKDNIALSDEHNSRGIELADRGWLDEAIKEFKKAIDLDPDSAHAHDNLATVYAEKKLYREALAEYLTALRLEPDSATAHYNLACFLSTHGPEMAVAEYKEAIELDPEYPDAHLNLGLTYADHGRIEEAMKELQTRHRARPAGRLPPPRAGRAAHGRGRLPRAPSPSSRRWCGSSPTTSRRTSTWASATRRRASTPRPSAPTRRRARSTPRTCCSTTTWPRSTRCGAAEADALELPRRRRWRWTGQKVAGWLATDPMFDSLKGDPEFESLL